MWQLASASMQGFRRALTREGFTEIATPKIVGTSTESGANVFAVDYFGEKAFLAQSPQLYKQTLVGVFERVFEVGPVFRAEPHDTVRHIAEYVSLDAELGFIEDHRDVLAVLRTALAGMLEATTELAPEALETLGVPVLGYGTDTLPLFYSAHGGPPVPQRVDDAETAARIARAHWALGGNGLLLTQPPPESLDAAVLIEEALAAAEEEGVSGQQVTPFVLGLLHERSGGRTRDVNRALIVANARLAAEVAVAFAQP
jgi:nondiscriminating aspartyl-tRNA synthetase